MINILTDRLPDAFRTSDGRELAFDTDFRKWLKIELLLQDDDIAPDFKQLTAVQMIFPAEKYSEELFCLVMWFFRCGEAPKSTGRINRKYYSAAYDAPYICAAFRQQYGIDLRAEKLHWWKYRALFRGLRDSKFTDIVSWRAEDIDNDLPESRKEFLYEMQELYELPKTLSERQRYERARKYLNGGG